ncbi:MAG: glycine zipper domain-containing protein [Gemmatales bacterium]|nr:glycine zipper domain-containing protein [Gemmatales bacterium]MCS7161532.1 glycine zipper domain-containing protein [Gemmatales bacterium]MDW8176735.1 glycine zipper domain-containing protein [Gemmatales bacterium]MDW8223526.1 glycine zipper domain-containing protein [Gemmatales bacterium]
MYRLGGMIAVVVLLSSGCATHTGSGAAVGGLLGSMAGLAVGSATGHPEGGALVGAALGSITGAAIGSSLDEQERRTEARLAAAEARRQSYLTTQQQLLREVVEMSQHGVAEETILAHVRAVGLPARLTAEQIIFLKNQGVSERVVQEMLRMTPRPATIVTPTTVIYERPAVIYDPGPVYLIEPVPPPVRFSFGYYYLGGRRVCP